jgi:hypothetical protein
MFALSLTLVAHCEALSPLVSVSDRQRPKLCLRIVVMSEAGRARIKPATHDFVVVRAPMAADAERTGQTSTGWSIVEWGTSRPVDGDAPHVAIEAARVLARLLAWQSGRKAWDATGAEPIRLPFVPLVSRDASHSYYSVSIDETDYRQSGDSTRWRSDSNLSASQVRDLLAANGFPGGYGASLIAAADR